jgi:hypothetical protein
LLLITVTVARQVGILQGRRHVRRPHRLGEAEAGAAGDAGIAVGHVDHGLFAMRQLPADARLFQRDQRSPQHRVDEEHMLRAR